jgi:hypothetical protein
MRSLSFVGLTVALFLPAVLCAQEKVESTPYYPLEVGTAWHYKLGDKKFVSRVSKHEKLGDTQCAVITGELDGIVLGDEYVSVNKEGLLRHKANGSAVDPPLKFFALPPKAGNWKVSSKIGPVLVKGTYSLEEAEIEVPAGKYKTWKLSTDVDAGGLPIVATQYFAKDIGMVKQAIKLGNQPEAVFELERFEKAK